MADQNDYNATLAAHTSVVPISSYSYSGLPQAFQAFLLIDSIPISYLTRFMDIGLQKNSAVRFTLVAHLTRRRYQMKNANKQTVGRELTQDEIDLVSGGQSYRINSESSDGDQAFGMATGWASTVVGSGIGFTVGGPIGGLIGGGIGFFFGQTVSAAHNAAQSSGTSGLGGSGASNGGSSGGGGFRVDHTGGTRILER